MELTLSQKFAYFTTIPIMLLQMSILGSTVWSRIAAKNVASAKNTSYDEDNEPVVQQIIELPKYECRIESPDSL